MKAQFVGYFTEVGWTTEALYGQEGFDVGNGTGSRVGMVDFSGEDSGGKAFSASDRVPERVWEGGGSTLTIEVQSSDPAVLRAYFAATAKNSGTPVRSLDTYEKVGAGSHSWTIDVPSAVGGDLEFQGDNPKPGSRLKWTVRCGSKMLARESETLNSPLQANEEFFLKFDAEDLAATEQE